MTKNAAVEVSGRIKWFNLAKGFGFAVCDGIEGDVLVHYSHLKEHGRRTLPEGAIVEVAVVKTPRGLQTERVLSIDLTHALQPRPCRPRSDAPRSAEQHGEAGAFEVLQVKWYDRAKGYGFLMRGEDDVFVHAKTVREAGFDSLWADTLIEAKVAPSARGFIAVDLRAVAEERKQAA